MHKGTTSGSPDVQSMTKGMLLYKNYRSRSGLSDRYGVKKDQLKLSTGRVEFTSDTPRYTSEEQEFLKESILEGKSCHGNVFINPSVRHSPQLYRAEILGRLMTRWNSFCKMMRVLEGSGTQGSSQPQRSVSAPSVFSKMNVKSMMACVRRTTKSPVDKNTCYKIRGKGMPKKSELSLTGLPDRSPQEIFFEHHFETHKQLFSGDQRKNYTVILEQCAEVHQMMMRMVKDPDISIFSVKNGFKMTPMEASGDQIIFEMDAEGDWIVFDAPNSSILRRDLTRKTSA